MLRTLPDNTSSQKRSFRENGPKIAKNRHSALPTLAGQDVGAGHAKCPVVFFFLKRHVKGKIADIDDGFKEIQFPHVSSARVCCALTKLNVLESRKI